MDEKFARSVLLKSLVLLLLVYLLTTAWDISTSLGSLSVYNRLVPGRERFPFGENPAQSYNVSVYDLDTLFASHRIAATVKAPDEYRVILIGDSSVWGTLQRPEETLAGQLEALGLRANGKQMRFYNLGYPTMSTLKDLLILQEALRYQPDLILWPVTLESLAPANLFNSPLVLQNRERVSELSAAYGLGFEPPAVAAVAPFSSSLVSRRRELADWVRLQLYGVMWGATGIDQYYPPVYTLAQRDFDPDPSFYDLQDPLLPDQIALNTLSAGVKMAGEVPVVILNEPIMVSSGENSAVRYNFYYPRWAYDQYRQILTTEAERSGWLFLDHWDKIFESEFTNTAVHLSPFGVSLEAALLQEILPAVAQTGSLPVKAAAAPGETAPFADLTGPQPNPTPAREPIEREHAEAPESAPQSSAHLLPNTGACLPPEQWQEMPILPTYISTRALEIYQAGLENGTRANVFSVIGDCQNVPQVFLGVFDQPGLYDLGSQYAYLSQTIEYFAGSWNRTGRARQGGLNVAAVLSPLRADPKQCEKGETPLQCELRTARPSIVIVSLEEWWSKKPVEIYEGYLRSVLDKTIASGAVPILATKADNLEGNHAINQTIAKLACEYQLPLWNYWRSVQPLYHHGLWTDGFHLTVGLPNFSDPDAMQTGRTMRNLTGLQVIDRVYRGLNQLEIHEP